MGNGAFLIHTYMVAHTQAHKQPSTVLSIIIIIVKRDMTVELLAQSTNTISI